MASLPIRWIEARTYCHATEDEARVERALAFACPGGESAREKLEGHWGNVLLRLTRRLQDRTAIRAAWDRWSGAGLPAAFVADVDARVDEDGVFHFRLDKQAAFGERLALAKDFDAIDVRLKLIAYPARPELARRVARSILPGAP